MQNFNQMWERMHLTEINPLLVTRFSLEGTIPIIAEKRQQKRMEGSAVNADEQRPCANHHQIRKYIVIQMTGEEYEISSFYVSVQPNRRGSDGMNGLSFIAPTSE